MTSALVIAFIGALIFGAHLFVGMFSRTRVPDVLLLIVIGLILGPVLHLVRPEQFGIVGPVFTTVTLVFILFESGTELKIGTLRSAFGGSLILAVLNFTVTTVVVAVVAWKMAHLEPMIALMLGAMLGGTSPAIVIPMSTQLKMGRDASAMLFLESAVGDVLSILIALAILDGRRVGAIHWGPVAGSLVASFLIAACIGALGAIFWSNLLSRVRTLQNGMFTTVAFVFLVFGITEMLGYSGVIAALLFVLRIPVVRFGVSTVIPKMDATRMAAMAPKGLAAAVLASLPLQQGVPGGELIQNSTYAVVLFSVILTSLLVFLQDRTPVGRLYRFIFKGFAKDEPEGCGEMGEVVGGAEEDEVVGTGTAG